MVKTKKKLRKQTFLLDKSLSWLSDKELVDANAMIKRFSLQDLDRVGVDQPINL